MEKPPTEKPLGPVHGPKMRLTNKHYWDDVYRAVEAKRYASVKDFLEAMHAKGNREFIEGFPGHRQTIHTIEDEFTNLGSVLHEIGHICARIAHSPQQEFLQFAFEAGLTSGAVLGNASNEQIEKFHAGIVTRNTQLTDNMKHYTDRAAQPLSRRDWAIHVAAGMYLREKMDRYVCEQADNRGRAQDAFCMNYGKKEMDAEPVRLTAKQQTDANSPTYFKQILEAPASLIILSKAEWRAIEAVALGMREPEETDYPKRLAPIKQALIKTGLYFDRPKFAEQLKAEQEQKALNRKGRTPE